MRGIRLLVALKPAMLVAFTVLTVPVLLALVKVTYTVSQDAARGHATVLLERFAADAVGRIVDDFGAMRSLVRTTAVLGAQESSPLSDDRALPYLLSLLERSPTVLSAYVGLESGDFRQARRLVSGGQVHGQDPPAGSSHAWRLVLAGSAVDRYVFLDPAASVLGSAEALTEYDPRGRPWYRAAVSADGPVITDPEVFWAFGIAGLTVAQPFSRNGRLWGVAAIDVTLQSFSAFLAQQRISPGSLSFVLDHRGRVLAASNGEVGYRADSGVVDLQHVTGLADTLAPVAYGHRPADGAGGMFAFSHEGRDHLAGLVPFPASFGKSWQLFVVTPLDDFTGSFTASNRRLMAFGLVAISVQLLLICLLANRLATPLQNLAANVARIERLETGRLVPVRSRLREIAALARATETLDSAVHSFAAFVPVGLVRQLLESEQKLELGGQSRFLTIFFSDIQGFSALAEKMPARELLLRVSAYLEVVTRAVNVEHGTIDKFVGDGVMAFWGAPQLLEHHAWHACVAALRVQREMAVLCDGWAGEDSPAMHVRIGIHSDAVLVGNIGSAERMSYTVMGDGVNLAARLESINKLYDTRICISHETFKEAGERLCVRPIDEVTVRGRRARVVIYELLGAVGADPALEPTDEARALARLTRSAFEALVGSDPELAIARYRDVLERFPGDPVARRQLERLLVGQGGGSPAGANVRDDGR